MLSDKAICNILYYILVFFSVGCNAQEKKDIYTEFPLGTLLTTDILQGSEQIILNESELILMYNISDQWDYFDPHLLFFNDSLKLYAASYFPSEKIESVNNNVITGYLNTKRNLRRNEYRNDMPEKYRLSLINIQNGHGRKSDKIIERIELNLSDTTVILHIRQSENAYIGIKGKELFADSNFLENFTTTDILQFPISDINIRYEENTVSISEITTNDRLRWDYMLVPKRLILDDFYNELFNLLSK